MLNENKKEFIQRYIIYIIAIFIFIAIIFPLIKPVMAATDVSFTNKNFYQIVLEKSFPDIEVSEDENKGNNKDNKDVLTVIFKYLTNIDIKNPKSYIASQIPILNVIDITSLVAMEDGPVIVKPQYVNNNVAPISSQDENVGKTITQVNVGDIKPKKLEPSNPLVLIFHTHTTENYNPDNLKDLNFTTDCNTSVCKVGEELKDELQNKYGIACLHDITFHDLPKRDGGYDKAKPTIQKYLKQYPGLKLIIDLHRDGDVPKNSATAIINNVNYARVMFVVGEKNPNYKANDSLTKNLNNILQKYYPNFTKGIDYQNAHYNQDLSDKLILIEVGSNTNTLQEAINTTKIIARAVAELLK